MDITLKPSEAASLMDCTVRAIRKRIALGKLDAVTIINKDNRPQYQIAISSLPPSAQEKYYARQRAELAAPADASSAPTAKALKPFDCYTEAEREEIVFWKRVLADWEKYRQRGGMNAAELDKRFLAYLALEYPDRKLSIATLYRKRKALAEGDLDGLVDGRGKGRKGKRSMPEPVWTFFRGALLQETKHMDIREAMRRTEEHFQLTDPDMLPLPSYSTFRRRVLEDIPPQVLCLGIYGEKALKDEFVPFVRRDYHVVRRDCYNVLARGPRGITDVLMSERSRAGSDCYTLLERRTVDGSGYLTIRYKLYVSENSSTLGHEVRLDSLPQYAALAPEHTYSVPFGGLGMTYIRLPMANNVDGSPDGVSVYEGAVQLIHNIYKNEYQLGREFELGRSRIVANADKLVTPDPEGGVMRLKDDVFVGLDGDTSVGMTIFSPTLRDESFERRKQSYLKACENIIGLKRGILSDVEAVERTAKEISSSEGDYSLSIMDLQRMWYDALMETLRITDLWGQALGLCDAQAVDLEQLLSVSWGNGVLYDADKDWADTLSMVEAGLLKPELALAKKYDLPSETPEDLAAIREKYMPEMVQLTAQAGLR